MIIHKRVGDGGNSYYICPRFWWSNFGKSSARCLHLAKSSVRLFNIRLRSLVRIRIFSSKHSIHFSLRLLGVLAVVSIFQVITGSFPLSLRSQ